MLQRQAQGFGIELFHRRQVFGDQGDVINTFVSEHPLIVSLCSKPHKSFLKPNLLLHLFRPAPADWLPKVLAGAGARNSSRCLLAKGLASLLHHVQKDENVWDLLDRHSHIVQPFAFGFDSEK